MLVLNRYIIFLFASFSFLYSTSLVFNPYGDMNTSNDDTDFSAYLDFVSSDMLSKDNKDKVSSVVSDSSTSFTVDNGKRFLYMFKPSLSSNVDLSNANYQLTMRDNSYLIDPLQQISNSSYDPFVDGVNYSSNSVGFNGGNKDQIVDWEYDYTEFLRTISINSSGSAHANFYSSLSDYKSALHLQDILYNQMGQMQLSFDSNSFLNSINEGIITGNVLNSGVSGKLDSIATLINHQGLGDFAVSSGIADVNNKLQDIENLLNSSPDGSEMGGVNDSINSMESLLNVSDFSYLDNFKTNIEQTVNDAISIKDDFNDAISLVEGDIPPLDLSSSGGSCASIVFNLMRETYYPLSNLPNILSRYSAVFTFFAYVYLMFLNFRFLFKFFALSK